MLIEPCSVAGAYVLSPQPHSDDRGWFARAWCEREFSDADIRFRPLQLNRAYSRHRGTMRGIHFQTRPHDEAKLVWCTRGSVFDVVVDLRADSPTANQWYGAELSAANGRMLYLPELCGHGCLSLEDDTEIHYLTSAFYAPGHARGVRHDDPALAIEWPVPVAHTSVQDASWPAWNPNLSEEPR